MNLFAPFRQNIDQSLEFGWTYLRHEPLYLSWALMEVALLAPVILAMMPWARYWPPWQFTLLILLLVLAPFNLGRLMSVLQLPVEKQRNIIVAALILTILLALRLLLYSGYFILDPRWLGQFLEHLGTPDHPFRSRDFTVFLLVALSWWRGLSLVNRRIDIRNIGLRFRLGALLLVPFVIGIAGGLLDWSVAPYVLLYFLAALMAVILTRVEQLEAELSGRSFLLGNRGPRWLLFVSVAAFTVITIVAILTTLASGRPAEQLFGLLAPVWTAVSFTLATALATFSLALSPLIFGLVWLVNIFFGVLSLLGVSLDPLSEAIATPGAGFPENEQELLEVTRIAPGLPRQLLGILIMLFIVLAISLTLRRIFKQLRLQAEADADLQLPGWQLERPGLGRRLLQNLGLLRNWRTAASIRRIYREMSALAAAGGYSRAESETPYEYLPTLAKAWPEHRPETTLITEAFIRVRYGEIPETRAEVDEILQAWKRLEKIKPAESGPVVSTIEAQRKS